MARRLMVAAAILVAGGGYAWTAEQPAAQQPDAERIGPPSMYMYDLARVERFARERPDRHPPIPRQPVNRETYFRWLEASGHFAYADQADKHGPYAPRHFTPALARFVASGERRYGEACVKMLKAFHEWLKQEVARTGWHSLFIDEPGYLGLYARYLEAGGLLDPKRDAWFRELMLFLNRNVHVWGTKETFWRGPMHRAQGEGAMKGVAALWYPDAPEAPAWRDYAAAVYQDWWRYRDAPPNDTGYLYGIYVPLFLRAELLGDEAFFNDPEARKTWDRMWQEVSPDGSVVPYGAHGGWNSTAGTRVLLLEMLARHTRDGRYRFVAHKLMNYLLYQQERCLQQHILAGPETTEKLALAYLLADDSIAPVPPDSSSMIDTRKETLRLRNHRDKRMAGRFLGQEARLDAAPDKAHICCGLIVTDKVKPSKLILRSGWEPGDFFVLVDLFPRHDPLNVPGILGMTRWGAALTCTLSAKGESDENRLVIQAVGKAPPRRRNQDPDLADPYYQEVETPQFDELRKAVFATVVVENYQGFPVRHTRELVFVKNRFLVCRDLATFEAGFAAVVGPVFNTQNVGPQIGAHWANTFMGAPLASRWPLTNPPVDLLVYFAPQPGCRMQVVDRTQDDPRAIEVPAQLRYVRSGDVAAGHTLHFTQLYWPHAPSMEMPKSNAAGDARNRNLVGTAGADAIEVLRDDAAASVLCCRFDPPVTEWIVCNPSRLKIEAGPLATDARSAYVKLEGAAVSASAVGCTMLSLDGRTLFQAAEPSKVEK